MTEQNSLALMASVFQWAQKCTGVNERKMDKQKSNKKASAGFSCMFGGSLMKFDQAYKKKTLI